MTATDVRLGDEPVAEPPPVPLDERISHRGPMRRWLLSPEIGALIGAVIVWAFFWGNGRTFGEADTTLNWLDVAAPTGIMAAAVALLMIGGEFDLSSGVMTGATAIQIGLMSRFFMGDGINIGWAILSAFLAAAAVGWFNGYMVNKTGLPSFIVTLASFFTLRGVMLVISKRLVGKVQVDQIAEQEGSKFFKDWIAHEWKFTEFGIRDKVFLGLVIVGGAVFIYGLLEQSYIRRAPINPMGVGLCVVGIVVAAIGFNRLLHTDGVGNNAAWGTVASIGVIAAIVGAGLARWVTRTRVAADAGLPPEAKRRLGLGVGCVILACLIPIPFDRRQSDAILTWTSSGLRPVIAVVAALVGIALAVRAVWPELKEKKKTPSAFGKLGAFAFYSGLLVMTMTICFLQLTTVQALRSIGMLLLSGAGLTFMMLARGIAGQEQQEMAASHRLDGRCCGRRSGVRHSRRLRRRAVPHGPLRSNDDRGDGDRGQHHHRVHDGEAHARGCPGRSIRQAVAAHRRDPCFRRTAHPARVVQPHTRARCPGQGGGRNGWSERVAPDRDVVDPRCGHRVVRAREDEVGQLDLRRRRQQGSGTSDRVCRPTRSRSVCSSRCRCAGAWPER